MLDENFHDATTIKSLVHEYVPQAEMNRHFGRELSFVLPRQHVAQFPALFNFLESHMKGTKGVPDLGFTSYGVSMTTLEEVRSTFATFWPGNDVMRWRCCRFSSNWAKSRKWKPLPTRRPTSKPCKCTNEPSVANVSIGFC